MKLYKKIILLLLLISNVVFSQSKILETFPSDAKIYNEENTFIGNTPMELDNLKDSNYKIKKEGYFSVDFKLLKNKKHDLKDYISFCEKCFVKTDENQIVFNLISNVKLSNNENIEIGFDTPVFSLDKEKVIGTINGKEKKNSSKDINRIIGFTENLENRLFSAFDGSFISPSFFNSNTFFKSDSYLNKPKVIIKPKISNLNFNLKGELLRDYVGDFSINIEWCIYDISDLNKQLFSVETSVQSSRLKNNYNLILHELIFISQYKLLENEGLFDKLKTIENKYLQSTIKENLDLKIIRSNENTIYEKINLNIISNSVVTIETENSFGSGFFISSDGYILTNAHLLNFEDEVYVNFNGKKLKAEIVRINKAVDLLLLKINEVTKGLVLNSSKINVGEEVFAIGTPLDRKFDKTITKGIVSADRIINGVDFIQTDVSINSGNSGGPLINNAGFVVGVNTMKLNGENVSGIGFSISIDYALKMLNIN